MSQPSWQRQDWTLLVAISNPTLPTVVFAQLSKCDVASDAVPEQVLFIKLRCTMPYTESGLERTSQT